MKNDSIAARIKKMRESAGLTQAQLAKMVGTTSQNISQYERGIRKPKIETLRKIAEALECSPAELDNSLASPMSVGDNIRYWRKYEGMTQQDLAERIGIEAKIIQKYEAGELKPKKKVLQNVAEVFDELPEWFCNDDSWTPEQYALRDLATYIELLSGIQLDQKDNAEPITEEAEKMWAYHVIPSIVKKYAVSEEWLKSVADSGRYGTAASDVMEVASALPREIQRVIQFMDAMNATGKRTAVERLEELAQIPKYQRREENDVDEAPAGDDLAPDDPGEADPAEKA